MTVNMHRKYEDLYNEMNQVGDKDPYENVIFFPETRSPFFGGYLFPSLVGVLVGVCLSVGVYSYFIQEPSARPEPKPTIPVVPVPEVVSETKESRQIEALESEVELMKKILVGLVSSVQTLTKETKDRVPELTESFPYPVKVISEKANLRSGPSREEKTVGVVPKDTVLLAVLGQDGWLQVSTPRGEKAWISADVVTENGE